MTDRLGHKQTAVLFALMALAGPVSNPELERVAGFRLYGKDRTELNSLKLVDSNQARRGAPFTHELTDQGWAWCHDELSTGTPPLPRNSMGTALYLLLAGLDGYLTRTGLRLADVFTGAAAQTSVPPALAEEVDEQPLETRIRVAYGQLVRAPRDWVPLVRLRSLLGSTPAADVDSMLLELSRTGRAHLVPESNRKTLTAADHEAAIRIGGEDSHLVSIEDS